MGLPLELFNSIGLLIIQSIVNLLGYTLILTLSVLFQSKKDTEDQCGLARSRKAPKHRYCYAQNAVFNLVSSHHMDRTIVDIKL